MPNYHSIATAARHATRRVSLSRSGGIHRPIVISSSTLASRQLSSSDASTQSTRIANTTRMMGSNSSSIHDSTLNNDTLQSSSSLAILVATIAATSSIAMANNNNSSTLCESPTTNNIEGLADETEEDSSNIIIQDGMDAGSEVPIKSPKLDNLSTAEENDDSEDTTDNTVDNTNNGTDTTNNNEEEDNDPSKDEETSCSICLINRQGPCRKQWLKFEKCMKEHGAEQDRVEKARKEKDASREVEELDGSTGGDSGVDVDDSIEERGEEKQSVSKEEMEGDWDDFMVKSTKPGEDDDDDDDEDDEEEDEDDDEESEDEDNDNSNGEDTVPSNQQEEDQKDDISLSQRCDKYMIPWISCIQEHRNMYSLISNDFYQKDYIDPLEYTVHDSRRLCYNKDHSEIGEVDGYVIKYHGVEIDLGSWREHVEAESDESNDDTTSSTKAAPQTEEPHLINAYAKFQLSNPTNGQPIEVAYIKDQNGRLLGFDSFTKSKEESSGSTNGSDEEGMPHKSDEEKAAAPPVSNDGECTFHIVPGETTSITAYAIYRGDVVKKEDESNEEGEAKVAGMREDFLFTTPAIPLPGMKNQK